jgi:IS5 family transposase
LKAFLGEDYREMSRRLAECQLFQWFCNLDELGPIRVPGKSTLHRYAHCLPAEEMQAIIGALTNAAASVTPEGRSALGLANAVELDFFWMDSTCIEANIHFPVDWVLVRDATRTLVKAIVLIRKHGIKHRMPSPEEFLSEMNKRCMEMTQSRRKADSKKARKQTLRAMKKIVDAVARHARRYHHLLDQDWEKTDWTRPQAKETLRRIESILEKLPAAKHQAHERIIGERPVANADKLLSLYEEEIHVIVRGKAGAEVEFGNTLFLAEQADGLIVDHCLFYGQAPADSKCLRPSAERIKATTGRPIGGGVGDRAFDSKANRDFLTACGAFNGLCPRSPQELCERQHEERFKAAQKRRAQTEGRIGILKNKFLGKRLRAKGYANRLMAIRWAVLAHNLWVLARMEQAEAMVDGRLKAA